MAKRGRKPGASQDESRSVPSSETRRGRNQPDQSSGQSLQRLIISAIVVILAIAVVYGRVASFAFVSWDDDVHVYNNPHLIGVDGPDASYFWGHAYRNLYIPATYTLWSSIASSAWPHGNGAGLPVNPGPFHVTSIVLHVMNALLVLLLLRLLLKNGRFSERIPAEGADWGALAGALAFAFHPLQVESVAWISETKGLFAAFFSLAALCCYGQYAVSSLAKKSGAWMWCVAAACAFLGAVLAKPSAVVLPLVAFALDLWIIGRAWKSVAIEMGCALILSVIVILKTQSAQPVTSTETLIPPIWLRPVVAGDALAFYLYKVIAPIHLNFDYGRSPGYVLAHRWAFATFMVPVVIAVVASRLPGVVKAAFAVFAASLLPVLGLTPFIYQVYSTVADRYAYMSMLGPALVIAWAIARRPSPVSWGVAGVLIAVWGVLTFMQLGVWRNNTTLYTHGIKENRGSWVAYANLATEQLAKNQIDPAQRNFEEAIALQDRIPKPLVPHPEAYNGYGTVLAVNRGRPADAIPYYDRALAIFPDYPEAHLNRGIALEMLGRHEEALTEVTKAVSLRPNYAQAEFVLGAFYGNRHDPADALKQFQAAVALDPNNAMYQAGLAQATGELNRQASHAAGA